MSGFNYGHERQRITSYSFPLPPIAVQGDLRIEDVRGFADRQAEVANDTSDGLDTRLASSPEAGWPYVFAEIHRQLVSWRHRIALELGRTARQAERFVTPITDEAPNIDPVGADVGFFHNGSAWNEELGRYAGGEETPASRQVALVGEWVTARFLHEDNGGDVLQNYFWLPNGELARGNSILRREAAHRQNQEGIDRAKAKGVDTSQFDIRGNFIYIKTATEADRAAIRHELYDYLAQLEAAHQNGERITVRQWAKAAYLFYQSPENKKGSDALTRVYLIALANRWMELPSIPNDIDWRAYAKSQDGFVDDVLAKSRGESIGEIDPYDYNGPLK
jgi:hypothetical protein